MLGRVRTVLTVMVRVAPERRAWALAQRHVRPHRLGEREPEGFVLVDPPGIATDEDLEAWIDYGLDAVNRLS